MKRTLYENIHFILYLAIWQYWCFVSKSWEQTIMSLILPKNERIFGRIRDFKVFGQFDQVFQIAQLLVHFIFVSVSIVRVNMRKLKFIYSEKATKFCKISTLLLTGCTVVKSKVEISQSFVSFLEYRNFKRKFKTQNSIHRRYP